MIDEHGICNTCGGLQPKGAKYVADTSRYVDALGRCRGRKYVRGVTVCGAVDARTVTADVAASAAEWLTEQY